MAELVDALVLGTSIVRCGGSSPFSRTKTQKSEEVIGLEQCFKAHYEGHYNTEPELLNRPRQAVPSAEPMLDRNPYQTGFQSRHCKQNGHRRPYGV